MVQKAPRRKQPPTERKEKYMFGLKVSESSNKKFIQSKQTTSRFMNGKGNEFSNN